MWKDEGTNKIRFYERKGDLGNLCGRSGLTKSVWKEETNKISGQRELLNNILCVFEGGLVEGGWVQSIKKHK